MNIKAIETIYNGIRFRSRLEARWAIFMDALGVKWEYEPEGFTDGTLCYLPDFWLPALECYLEIKPTAPSDEEIKKAKMVVCKTGKDLFFAVGPPVFRDETECGAQLLPHDFEKGDWDYRFDFTVGICGRTEMVWQGRWDDSGLQLGINRLARDNAVYQANNYRFGGHT